MKIVGQIRLAAIATGFITLGLSGSLMAMPFCGDKGYGKRYHDPYAYTYVPGHGGYAPHAYYRMPAYHHPQAMAYSQGYHSNGYVAGGAEGQSQTEGGDSTESSSGY